MKVRKKKMGLLLIIASLIVTAYCKTNADYWTEFKAIYEKTYKSTSEEDFRFKIFNLTCNMIEEHNARYEKGEVSYFLRINHFADLTDLEFKSIYLTHDKSEVKHNHKFELPKGTVVPDAIDWRKKGAVFPVQEQGNCASSHVFSAIGALEGQNFIKHNVTLALSEQEVIDCSKEYKGCDGGNFNQVFEYVKENGISTYSSYPYYAKTNVCKKGNNSGVQITGYVEVPGTEESLKESIGTIGPVSVEINLLQLRYYGGGIFDDPLCSKTIYHAALVVGYGTENNKDYWIIKNSWGKTWGEGGYVRLRRNSDQQCGIGLKSFYPIIN